MMSMMTQFQSDSTLRARQPILWIDGVGGYLLVDSTQVSVGQAVMGSRVDIGIVGDLSRQAAIIRRIDGDYLLQPLQPATQLNGQSIDRAQLLSQHDEIAFGPRVRMTFTRPNPLSATARLELPQFGRFQPHVDAVLLMADACILGPNPGSHVICSQWVHELLLVRHGTQWCLRATQELEVNGQLQRGQIPLAAGMRVCGADFSLSIE
jgi:hypothetical protein